VDREGVKKGQSGDEWRVTGDEGERRLILAALAPSDPSFEHDQLCSAFLLVTRHSSLVIRHLLSQQASQHPRILLMHLHALGE